MKPVYFPFTFVSGTVAEAVSACFGQFVVYSPAREIISDQMQLWIEREIAEVRAPGGGDDEALKAAVNNYQVWADIHLTDSIEKTSFIRTGLNPVPFLSELSSSKIIDVIKGQNRDKPLTQIPDPELSARLFLYFAHEFDRQNQELTDGLNHYDQQEAHLIRRLKMEDDPVAEELRNATARQPESPPGYMISDRLEAWVRVFCQEPEDTGLFVTHSPAVMEYLLDETSSAERILHLKSIPSVSEQSSEKEAWQEKLAINLARYAGQKQIDTPDEWVEQLHIAATNSAASLSVYMVPDQTPREFYGRFAALNRPVADFSVRKCKFQNTLIALIECTPISTTY